MIDINYGPYAYYDPKTKYQRTCDIHINGLNNSFDSISSDTTYISFDEDFKERKDNENEI